ncbi:MAG: apolipoprotein N-acyltransferase [Verrucomicrobiota bacterium]
MADTPNVPLVVDLDGTIIRTDLMWESLALLLRRNPLCIFQIPFWWSRGRARLKQQLSARVRVDAASLPYHARFLDWVRKEKTSGRKVIMATASDRRMVQPVVDYLGLFDEVLASDGKTNLRREHKRQTLVQKFGERGFDYAGNSEDDLAVWRSARTAIVVNASAAVLRQAAQCAEPGPAFCEGFVRTAIARRFLFELFWQSGYLPAVGAGVLLALAFPKTSVAGFAWAAPAVMLAAAHGKSRADSFRVGYVCGLAFWLASLYWLLLMPAPVYSVVLGWLALSAYVALYFGAWLALVARPHAFGTMKSSDQGTDSEPQPSVNPEIQKPIAAADSWSGRLLWGLGGAAAWVALEMVRARLLGGFPWSFLGVSQYQLTPLLQIAALTGVYGLSFLVAWFSLALYSAGRMILQQPSRRHVWQAEIVLPMLAVVACYVGGFVVLSRPLPDGNPLRVTAIQPSVPQTLIWSPSDDARRFQALLDDSQRALTNKTDLLVWPESAVPVVDEATYQAINQFVRSNHLWLILNAEDADSQSTATNYFNAAFIVGPDGHWRSPYHKRQLVIFGEYVPLANWLPFLKWLTPIQGAWTPGDKAVTFELARPTATQEGIIEVMPEPLASAPAAVGCAPLICFEDTFAGAARDSAREDVDFLVNLTNDGWFGESAEQWQHMANAIFRAVENGLPLLRCANNGVTCLVDAHGRVETVFRATQHGEYGRGALTVEIPLSPAGQKSSPTFYHRHGDWFGWSCVGVTILMLVRRARESYRPPAIASLKNVG